MSAHPGIYKSEAGGRILEERYRELLAVWPVPSEHLRIPTREGETFVVASGPPDAPPVLLLHGSSANASSWLADVPAWSKHFRLYAVDMIGEPGLSAPSRPALDSDAYALWLDDVHDGLDVARASIVGVSLGGWLSLDYATRRPDRVDRLALICPGGIGRQKTGVLILALLLLPFGRRGRRRMMNLVLGTAVPPAVGADMMLISSHFRPRLGKLPVFDDDALRRLTMPVQVTVGGRDRFFDSRETQRRLERAVPHTKVRFLPDTGHLVMDQTQPVLDFLLDRVARG